MIVDIETTGLSRYRHKITEICALKYRDGKVVDEFSSLVNPECSIPRFITRLTGIDNEMVKDSPTIGEVIPDFAGFVKGCSLVAHNATFDFNFLNHAVQEHLGKELDNSVICTCRLARRLLPELPSKKLGCICEHFSIDNLAAHRAKGDALATTEIFSKFLEMVDVEDVPGLIRFQKSKIPR